MQALSSTLRSKLQPFSDAFGDGMRVQARVLSENMDEAKAAMLGMRMGDIRDITATQLLTVLIIMFLAYMVFTLMWTIAQINDHFDRHTGLLVSQKSKHRTNQMLRELRMDDEGENVASVKQDCTPP